MKPLSIVAIDGLRWHYQEEGAGPPLLFLHGFNGGAGLWAPNLQAAAAAGFRAIAPDLLGWGDTPPPPGFPYRMGAMVQWLTRFLQQVICKPVIVIGHSFGGAVALHLALDQPDLVRGLVLANSAGLSPQTLLEYRLLGIPGLGERMLKPDLQRVRQTLATELLGDISRMPPEVLAYGDRVVFNPWFVATSLRWVRRNHVLWQGARAICALARLREIRQPVLLLVSDDDRVIPAEQSLQALPHFANARLTRYPGARHLLPLDRQAEFDQEVAQFARTVAPA